jgi:ankyrin repeat protein
MLPYVLEAIAKSRYRHLQTEVTMTIDPSMTTAWHQYNKQTLIARPSLSAAARANDVAELARLIADGGAIDEADHRGYTPLMIAAYAGSLDALELLLGRGADPNSTDLFGNTVLMGAAFKGHVMIVLRLLAAGADPNSTNHGGLDARGFALTFGRADVFALLDQHTS